MTPERFYPLSNRLLHILVELVKSNAAHLDSEGHLVMSADESDRKLLRRVNGVVGGLITARWTVKHPKRSNPSAVEMRLEKIWEGLQGLADELTKLPMHVQSSVNRARRGDYDPRTALGITEEELLERSKSWPIQKASIAMSELQDCIAVVIDEYHEASKEYEPRPEGGRPPNFHAREVALLVARFAYLGCIDGQSKPSKYAFRKALEAIFQELGIENRDARKPMEWALAKLCNSVEV